MVVFEYIAAISFVVIIGVAVFTLIKIWETLEETKLIVFGFWRYTRNILGGQDIRVSEMEELNAEPDDGT